jgi:spore germination cell wall hydrolase CwlJ-like protein
MVQLVFSLLLSALTILTALPAAAGGSMVSFFPEDIAVEEAKSDQSFFDIQKLAKLFPGKSSDTLGDTMADLQADANRLVSSPPKSLKGETSLACTAVAVFFEARGESFEGQEAVASVVLQRALTPGRWGSTPCDVVRPVQFEFMTSRYGYPRITKQPGWQTSWPKAVNVAAQILAGGPLPELKGADHYHTRQSRPYWRLKMPRVAAIGNHFFYADPLSRK